MHGPAVTLARACAFLNFAPSLLYLLVPFPQVLGLALVRLGLSLDVRRVGLSADEQKRPVMLYVLLRSHACKIGITLLTIVIQTTTFAEQANLPKCNGL